MKTEAFSKPCQTSGMEPFAKNGLQLKVVNYFRIFEHGPSIADVFFATKRKKVSKGAWDIPITNEIVQKWSSKRQVRD